jgi:SAM-dependent methyltransferase
MGLQERKAKCLALVHKYYANVPRREAFIDDAVRESARMGGVLLDAGCGDTLPLLNRYSDCVRFAVGIDRVTPSEKPARRAAVTIGDLTALPFRNGAFDLIVSRSVVEHLEEPAAVFQELARTLKPGGKLIFTTPNKYYYSSMVARLIPYSWKDSFMRRVFGPDGYDHFPVFYRANTRAALTTIARNSGLRVERLLALRSYPYYLMFSTTLFRIGMVYDWLVTRLRADRLQSMWCVTMERQLGSTVLCDVHDAKRDSLASLSSWEGRRPG